MSDEQFIPETVDEQIEHHLKEENKQASAPFLPSEARLVHGLHKAYEDDGRALERVRARLTEHVGKLGDLPFDTHQYQQRGPHLMNNILDEKKSLRHHLGILAATILVAALVGSFALIFNLTHQAKIGAQPKVSQKTTVYDQSGIYASTMDGLYRLNKDSGKILWHFYLNPSLGSGAQESTIGSVPVVSNGIVYFSGRDGKDYYLYAVYTANGKIAWKKAMESVNIQVADGIVFANVGVQVETNSFVALDAATGTLRWSASISNLTFIGEIQNNVVYASSSHTLYALNTADGTVRWSTTITSNQILVQPHLVAGTLYISSYNQPQKQANEPEDCYVYAYNPTNGQLLWQSQVIKGWITEPAISNGLVYFGSVDGHVYALDANNGTVRWNYVGNSSFDTYPPQVENGIVYVHEISQNLASKVIALNATSGGVLWTRPSTMMESSSPIKVAAAFLYYGALGGAIYVLNIRDGTEVKQYQITARSNYPDFKNSILDILLVP